jgi:outer membrane protein TolC
MQNNKFILLFLLSLLLLPHVVRSEQKQPVFPQHWTVVEAVNYALKNNPDAGIALHRIKSAEAAIRQARAAFYPQLGLSAEYGQTNNPIFSFGNILNQGSFTNDIDFNDPGTTDNLRLAATLKYRLYNGGRDQAGVHAAEARQQAEKQQRKAVLSTLADQVVRSFYTIVQAREIVAARKSAVSAITASLKVAKARYDAGDLLKASLLDIEVQQSSAHEQLIQAKHGLNLAKRGFLNLLGLKIDNVDIDLAQQFPQQVPDNPDGSLRPEMQSLSAMIQAAEKQLIMARGEYYPTADLFGSYQIDQGFIDEDNGGNSWMAGVRLNYNLYEGGSTQAAVAAAGADLSRAKELRRKMGLTIAFEIEKAQLALKQAEERLLVTDKQVTLANESARLSRERFREGVILSSSLIDAENRLTDARVHSSLAKAERMIAIADLRRAAGLPQFPGTETDKGQRQAENSSPIQHR